MDMIQVGSFVHPTKVPQMADTDELFRALTAPGVRPAGRDLSGLVLNEKGLERGMACGVADVLHGRLRQRDPQQEEHRHDHRRGDRADHRDGEAGHRRAGAKVQVSVQSAFGCGYEGPVPQERVLGIVRRYVDAGLSNISLADTAGHATPDQVERLFDSLHAIDRRRSSSPATSTTRTAWRSRTAMRRMTRGRDNRSNPPSPASAGARSRRSPAGTYATEDLVHMLHRMGLRTDVSLDPLIGVARRDRGVLRAGDARHGLPDRSDRAPAAAA